MLERQKCFGAPDTSAEKVVGLMWADVSWDGSATAHGPTLLIFYKIQA